MGIVIKKWKKNWKIMIMRGNNNFYLNEYNVNRPSFLNKVYFFLCALKWAGYENIYIKM